MIGGTAAADFATDQLTEDDWQSLRDMAEVREPLTFNDFLFSLTDNEFICIPAGSNKFWPAVSVNMTVDGPPTVDPVLEREFRTHEAAKAFAKADAGWAEVERVKVKRPKMTKAATVVMRDRFASGLDIDLDFESPQEPPSDKSSEADPQPALSDAQRRVRRLIVLMGTTPQILRAWLLENGMFMPRRSLRRLQGCRAARHSLHPTSFRSFRR